MEVKFLLESIGQSSESIVKNVGKNPTLETLVITKFFWSNLLYVTFDIKNHKDPHRKYAKEYEENKCLLSIFKGSLESGVWIPNGLGTRVIDLLEGNEIELGKNETIRQYSETNIKSIGLPPEKIEALIEKYSGMRKLLGGVWKDVTYLTFGERYGSFEEYKRIYSNNSSSTFTCIASGVGERLVEFLEGYEVF